jgi:hypothetical protein
MKARRRSIIFTVLVTLVAAYGIYHRQTYLATIATFDLRGAKSSTIKNEPGQAADLYWWKPAQSPPAVFVGDEEDPKQEWTSMFVTSNWLENRWVRVALLGARDNNQVKVFLLDKLRPSDDSFFLAKRSELTQQRPPETINHEPENEE